MTLLQAAMGLGLYLESLIKILVLAGIPFVTTILTIGRKKSRDAFNSRNANDIFKTILINFLYAILVILAFSVAVFIFLYFAVDLAVS